MLVSLNPRQLRMKELGDYVSKHQDVLPSYLPDFKLELKNKGLL